MTPLKIVFISGIPDPTRNYEFPQPVVLSNKPTCLRSNIMNERRGREDQKFSVTNLKLPTYTALQTVITQEK